MFQELHNCLTLMTVMRGSGWILRKINSFLLPQMCHQHAASIRSLLGVERGLLRVAHQSQTPWTSVPRSPICVPAPHNHHSKEFTNYARSEQVVDGLLSGATHYTSRVATPSPFKKVVFSYIYI